MIGSVLSNRYELVENIGAGGMAIVYKAKCRLLNRYVAVKVLRPEFQEDSEFLMRFNVEAQAAASLSHPNIVSVFDVGQHGKLNYIVMELVEGITLKEYLSKKESLSINEAIDFSLQIASALEHAHSKGIIHRDIKPHNIIITNEGVLKVTDFGLARAATSSTIIAGASAMGSVHYASPEQARGNFTDERTDIYSLGVVMYELFTGALPFDGDTPISVAMKHIQKEPQPPNLRNPQIPEYIEAIILKSLNKDPKDRYGAVTELIRDLKHYEKSGSHGSNKFSTQRLPSIIEEEPEKPLPNKKNKKKDGLTVISAIVAALIVMSLLGFGIIKIFFPGGIFKAAGSTLVPELINQSFDDVIEKYKGSAEFEIIETQRVNDERYLAGVIIDQSPTAGTKTTTPCTISVTISLGPKSTTLKDYTGQDYRLIESELKDQGLNVKITKEFSDEFETGKIIRHNPSAGYQISSGNTIYLYVSEGKNTKEVEMPQLIGKSDAEARSLLKDNDLNIGVITKEASESPENTVISQSVNAGDMVSSQTAINYTISLGQGNNAGTGTATLSLDLPSDKDTINVKLKSSNSVLFEGTFSTEHNPITVRFSGKKGVSTVDVYYDDVLKYNNMSVNFE